MLLIFLLSKLLLQVDQDGSTSNVCQSEDVICLSNPINIERHRPIAIFDAISGGHSFKRTVIKSRIEIDKYIINESEKYVLFCNCS